MKVPGLASIQGLWNRYDNQRKAAQRREWQKQRNPAGRSVPGFLIGCGRSGTTMLVRHLARSLAVEAYNENDPQAFERWRLRPLPTIEEIVKASHADVVLFKPILSTPQAVGFLSYFSASRVVFVFRHYDDVINSSMKKFGAGNRLRHVRDWMESDFEEFGFAPPPVVTRELIADLWQPGLSHASGAALYWLFYNRLFFDLPLVRNPRVLLVGYEALVQEPEEWMRAICAHLQLAYEPHLIEGIFTSSIQRDPAPDVAPAIRAACEVCWTELSAALTLPQPVKVAR